MIPAIAADVSKDNSITIRLTFKNTENALAFKIPVVFFWFEVFSLNETHVAPCIMRRFNSRRSFRASANILAAS